jgi:hypothetical protein
VQITYPEEVFALKTKGKYRTALAKLRDDIDALSMDKGADPTEINALRERLKKTLARFSWF